jgi:hypothetical protein
MSSMCAVPDAKTSTGDCSWVKVAEDTYAGTDASWGTVSTNPEINNLEKMIEGKKLGSYEQELWKEEFHRP